MSLNSTPGDPAADSYAALVFADSYFTKRGEDTWTGTDAVKENALRRGTTYLENQYRDKWRGITVAQFQALSWPRLEGYRDYWTTGWTQPLLDLNGWQMDETVVPVQVQQAACEAALLYLQGVVLEPRLVRGGAIKSLMEKVDVLQTETIYQDGAPAVDRFVTIEGLLRGLVIGTPGASSGTGQIVRS